VAKKKAKSKNSKDSKSKSATDSKELVSALESVDPKALLCYKVGPASQQHKP